MKNILFISDPNGGGGTSTPPPAEETDKSDKSVAKSLAALEKRIAALESAGFATKGQLQRLAEDLGEALEERPEVHRPHRVKGMTELFKAELESLTDDPDSAIEAKMEFGLTKDQATTAVQRRVAFLKTELGVAVKAAKSVAKKAAAIITILALLALTLFSPRASADQQGLDQTFVTLTNFPAIVTGLAQSNINAWILLRPGKGIGLQWQYNAQTSTNVSVSQLYIAPSVDGTNVDSFDLWKIGGAANGSNTVTVTTNWSDAQLRGFKALVVLSETNANPGANSAITNGAATFGPTNSAVANVPNS